MPTVDEMAAKLRGMLSAHTPTLRIKSADEANFVVEGTIPTMQGKQKVDGIYFASVVPKAKDVRLYFFPIYTHVDAFTDIPADLRKYLKGKSCFHIKNLEGELEEAVQAMIDRGVAVYQEAELLER